MSTGLALRGTYTSLRSAPGLKSRHAVWYQSTLACTALLAVCVLLALVDERTLYGVNVWAKPIKFSLSLAVYFATLAWFAPLMPAGYFDTLKGRLLTWIPVVCTFLELGYIVFQASQGEPSHFNNSTPFHGIAYSLMGAGAVLLVLCVLWMGVAVLREHGLKDPFVLAVGLGFIGTFLLGGGFGGYLGGQSGHWVGGTPSDAEGLALFRWSQDGGDLRVAHFFGMHAMQVLPLLAALLPAKLAPRLAILIVVLGFLAYAGLTTWTFVQAVNGQPFLS